MNPHGAWLSQHSPEEYEYIISSTKTPTKNYFHTIQGNSKRGLHTPNRLFTNYTYMYVVNQSQKHTTVSCLLSKLASSKLKQFAHKTKDLLVASKIRVLIPTHMLTVDLW